MQKPPARRAESAAKRLIPARLTHRRLRCRRPRRGRETRAARPRGPADSTQGASSAMRSPREKTRRENLLKAERPHRGVSSKFDGGEIALQIPLHFLNRIFPRGTNPAFIFCAAEKAAIKRGAAAPSDRFKNETADAPNARG